MTLAQKNNASDAGPRRSSSLARNWVSLRAQEEVQEPGTLPYFIKAVEEGMAGRWRDRPL